MSSSTHDERWKDLCQAIVEGSDSNRLMELVNKLNCLLEDRESEFEPPSDGRGLSPSQTALKASRGSSG